MGLFLSRNNQLDLYSPQCANRKSTNEEKYIRTVITVSAKNAILLSHGVWLPNKHSLDENVSVNLGNVARQGKLNGIKRNGLG